MSELIQIALGAKAEAIGSQSAFRVGVKNATATEPAEMFLDGEIGDEFDRLTSSAVAGFLRHNKGRDVVVRINSPGGLVFDGITIHNALARHDGKVTTVIDGLGASIASVIAMAGHKRQMYENAQMMIHRAIVGAIGNEDIHDEASDICRKCTEAIARTYKARTGMSMEKIYALMKGPKGEGTWFNAREALDGKWIDEIVPLSRKAVACAGSSGGIRDRSFSSIAAMNERLSQRQWLHAEVAKKEKAAQ